MEVSISDMVQRPPTEHPKPPADVRTLPLPYRTKMTGVSTSEVFVT